MARKLKVAFLYSLIVGLSFLVVIFLTTQHSRMVVGSFRSLQMTSASQVITNRRDFLSQVDRKNKYLVVEPLGRLGNVLFELATGICVAKLNKLTLITKYVESLDALKYVGLQVHEDIWKPFPVPDLVLHKHTACCRFNQSAQILEPKNSSHIMFGFFQSWRYFEPCKADVLRAIQFIDPIVQSAKTITYNFRKKFSGRIVVGVHVRMEDYLSKKVVRNGNIIASPDYFHRAMKYFRAKFKDVTFVVFTANETWFHDHVSANMTDVMMFGRSESAAVDMEVLSRLDHLILSVGTFGWWAGYKSNGTVVICRNFYVHGSLYARSFKEGVGDYFYPGWILM